MLAAAALMSGVSSCSNDDNAGDGGPNLQTKAASLTISIENSGTRAAGSGSGADNTVVNFTVFVIDDKGTVAWEEYVDLSGSGTNPATLDLTTAATEVYVVANGGNQTGKYTTKTALLAATETLTSQFTSRWATGNATIASTEWTDNGSGKMEASKTLALQFMAARIQVTVANNMTGYDGSTSGTTILNDVAILSANGESLLFASGSPLSLIPSGGVDLWAGLDLSSLTSWPASVTVEGILTDSYVNTGTFPNTQEFHYYVYENNAAAAADYPTVVTVVGTDADGNAVYYPVHLAAYEQFKNGSLSASVERGKSYNITITLGGDATSGNGGGGTDPLKPVASAELEVTISITDWIPVVLEKEFN